jgi:hypothetical protein
LWSLTAPQQAEKHNFLIVFSLVRIPSAFFAERGHIPRMGIDNENDQAT